MKSDKELVNEYKQGNERAFSELFHRYNKYLLFYLQLKTRGELTTCEDALQEAWARAFLRINSFTDNSFRAWLYRIARNRWIDVNVRSLKITNLKKEKYLDLHYEECIPAEIIPDEIFTEANKKKLMEAIFSIDKVEHREVLLLRTYYNMPFHKISGHFKTGNINTALARYRYGAAKVKKSMLAGNKKGRRNALCYPNTNFNHLVSICKTENKNTINNY